MSDSGDVLQLSQDIDVYDDNQDELFISTQVQSRLDDLEQEIEQKKSLMFLKDFAHINTESSSKRVRRMVKSLDGVSKKKTKKKTKRKKLSVTAQMINRLSGKPLKAIRMGLDQDKTVLSQHLVKFEQDENKMVFTDKEWQQMMKVLGSKISTFTRWQRKDKRRDPDDNDDDDNDDNDEWWMGNNEPSYILKQDLEELYKGSLVRRTEEEDDKQEDKPITLSQITRPIFEVESGDNDSSEISATDEDEPLIFPTYNYDLPHIQVEFRCLPKGLDSSLSDDVRIIRTYESEDSCISDSMDDEDWTNNLIQVRR